MVKRKHEKSEKYQHKKSKVKDAKEDLDFELIEENEYNYRHRNKLREEDIHICNCPKIPELSGCEDESCINRMTFIECTKEYCPCGENCANQRFQKREYAKVERTITDKKGYGLRVLQDLKPGQLVIEYVGEVISNEECKKRMKKSQYEKNFYFLTLDGSECIDAKAKGNLARYINHSCEPNCQTQKWFVNGEMRVGIFALKDITAGTELTFDYQFERFGAKKQKCFCQSYHCRGSLGNKPKHIKNKSNGSLDHEVKMEQQANFAYVLESFQQRDEFSIKLRTKVKNKNLRTEVKFKPFLNRNIKNILKIRKICYEELQELLLD